MAGNGPPPTGRARRRNADAYAGHEASVPADARVVDPPALPGADDYSPQTAEWYRTWCESPQATVFTATDWQRLHMLAPLVESYWQEPTTKLMAEIRLNEQLLGATHVDRLRARMKVTPPKPEEPGDGVARLDDYRELYG